MKKETNKKATREFKQHQKMQSIEELFYETAQDIMQHQSKERDALNKLHHAIEKLESIENAEKSDQSMTDLEQAVRSYITTKLFADLNVDVVATKQGFTFTFVCEGKNANKTVNITIKEAV